MIALRRQFRIARLSPPWRQCRKREIVGQLCGARRRTDAIARGSQQKGLRGDARDSSSKLPGVGLKVQEGPLPTSDEPVCAGQGLPG